MSRSYNEDWERKKSYLIRSLFHDIPFRALSPVTECSEEISNQSSDTKILQDSISSQEISSGSKTTTSSTPSEPVPPPSGVYTTPDTRPHSPLPPLIIERMPNRHDDPPEYYQILLNKIKSIYRKMFIEGKHLSDDDLIYSDNEKQSILNEVFEMAGSLSDMSEVSCSFSTDGYSADTETSDYEESNDNLVDSSDIIDNYGKRVAEKFDEVMASNNVEEYSNDNAFISINNNIPSNVEKKTDESVVSEEEADYRQITTQADVHIDGAQLAAVSSSPVYEGTPAQVIFTAINEAESFTSIPAELLPNPPTFINNDPAPQTAFILESNQECALSPEPVEMVAEELPPEPNLSVAYANPPADAMQAEECTQASLVVPTVFEGLVTSPILPYARKPKKGVHACQERLGALEDEDAENSQTTTQTKVDSSSSLERQENKNSLEQGFILRFSKSTEHSFAREKEATVLKEPLTTSTEDSEKITSNHVEVMRTPRPRASAASIPIDTTRLTDDMDVSCERDFVPRDISTVTSPSQDGDSIKDLNHRKISCDIDDVLTSIFNVSLQANNERASKGSNGRKRIYEEMSAQTENVSWTDLRANFFVGTPKIFRLCTCADHVCNN